MEGLAERPALPLAPVTDSRLQRCAGCGEGLAATGVTFWLVTASRAILDPAVLRRRTGLAMAIGNTAIANAFNDEPVAQVFDQPPERCVCETCACTMPLAALVMEPAHG